MLRDSRATSIRLAPRVVSSAAGTSSFPTRSRCGAGRRPPDAHGCAAHARSGSHRVSGRSVREGGAVARRAWRIALKGGTALNLFVLDVPRLSVDIDLNVVGAVERETMLSERPKVEQALGAVCSRLGLQVRRAPGEHAGGKWRLAYSSSFGRRDWRRVSLADVTADPVDREGDTKYRRRSRRQRSSSASASASAGGLRRHRGAVSSIPPRTGRARGR